MKFSSEAEKTLARLKHDLDLSCLSADQQSVFEHRLQQEFPLLFSMLLDVYGDQYDFYYHLQQLMVSLRDAFEARKPALKKKDEASLNEGPWFKDHKSLGIACYVDLFAGDLAKLKKRIPYLVDLGVTYIHLMPLYKSPEGDSDGGYAVSDYRQVDPKLGSIEALATLADAFAKAGIHLVLDFVFNHSSDEHQWAEKAKQGDPEFQNYYWMFESKDLPNQYETHLREIFPQVRKGNFTWCDTSKRWVWTTFNSFQWDLNYSNPAVFNAITQEMLFLANIGCDALRLDALAFIWKELGTNCEIQPKAHRLISAFNACLKIVSPSVVFKSEAIVHPDEVLKYIAKDKCELSYNPLLMALIWNSLATRKTKLLTQSMQQSFAISPDCAWVNYIRCHDDIGWTFDDAVAYDLGINPHDHRYFLNQFFTGRFEGSFAKGVAFAENKETGDCRVCGSLASLAGLESALEHNDQALIDLAVARILMVHSIILSIGGIPLLYSGDELGLLNDYSYQSDINKLADDRWVHRIAVNDKSIKRATAKGSPEFVISSGLKKLISIRKSEPLLGKGSTEILQTNNEHVFAYSRKTNTEEMIALCNFSEHQQFVKAELVGIEGNQRQDLISQQNVILTDGLITLAPYQICWLK